MRELGRWWRFASGLFGGRVVLGGILAVLPALVTYLGWLLVDRTLLLRNHYVWATSAAGLASMVFLFAVIGRLALWRFMRENPLARLAPGLDREVRRLSLLALSYALIALVVAVLYRGWAMTPHRYLAGELISFTAVAWRDYALHLGWLLFAAALIVLSVQVARIPLRYSYFAVYMAAAPSSSTSSMLTLGGMMLGVFAMACIGYGWTQRRRQLGDARFQSPPEFAWVERVRAWRLRRALSAAARGGSRRFAALMLTCQSPQLLFATILVAVLYLLMAGSSSIVAPPSFWMLAMVAAVVAMPQPVPVARLLLLPRTASRRSFAMSVLRAWLTAALLRLAIAVVIWFLLNTLFWAIDWRPFGMARIDIERPGVLTELLWRPLTHGAALAGTVTATCLLLAATPQLLFRSAWMYAVTLMAATVSVIGAYLIWTAFGGSDEAWSDPARLPRYALAAGVAVPLLAAVINRALAFCWRDVNLARLASGMSQFAERLDAIRMRGW